MGVSFQGRNHSSGDRGTAPKSDIITVAAPQRKVAGTTWLLCARPPRLSEQARDGGQASPGSPELLAWGR